MHHPTFSSFQCSFSITITYRPAAASKTTTKDPQDAPLDGSGVARKLSATAFPRFVEVIVGSHEELRGWLTQEDELTKIPYFNSFLTLGALDGQIDGIRLPDDKPHAFEQVLHFVRYEKMQHDLVSLCKHNNTPNPDFKVFSSKSTEIVKTYVLTKKLGLEKLQNAACDQLRNAMAYMHLTSFDMLHIADHCDQKDPLYRLSMQSLAVNIHRTGWSCWRVQNTAWFNAFCDGKPTHAQLIAEELQKYEGAEYPPTGDGVCQWHSHVSTSACEPPRTSSEVDLADMKRQDDPLPGDKEDETKCAVFALQLLTAERDLEVDVADMTQFEFGSYDHNDVVFDLAC